MLDLCLSNCKIVPENIEYSIGINDGKIVSIKRSTIKAGKTIEINGKIVLPGLIDAHVHLRDPGFTYKEDFRSGTTAAAGGGFTTVLDMPNTKPPTNTAETFKNKIRIGENKSLVDFGLHAGADNPEQIKKLAALKPASFKIFMDLFDDDFLMNIFGELSDLPEIDGIKTVVSLHAEDKEIVNRYTNMVKSKENLNPIAYVDARPPLAEEIAVSKAILLAKEFNLKMHVCHASTKKSLNLIKKAKFDGCNITSEVTPHHLFLDSSYFEQFGNFAKTNPPLRNKANKINLIDLHNVDIIGTDHAPHTISEKEENIWNAPPGIPGLETALPLILTQINRGKTSFEVLKKLLCENPARIFNLKNKGFIKEGMDADFVVVDMKKEDIINPDNFYSKAHYSPFKGQKVQGLPIMTILRGEIVMKEGEVYETNGKFVYS
ncbi:dihydroorotase family protein [Methanobacterium sp. SMA-27]|uniref:dihydroorotase n=1 Tax=Methanobacterium sp. SMA-27 TaxID=1495336 RepID=UPI00064E1E77|nr:dihydroorotase family protein [Methanobacterium sp. SMA-27]